MANAYTNRKISSRYPLDLGAWKSLATHYRQDMRGRTLRDLFSRDKKRVERFGVEANDLFLDYSKNHINARTRKLLAQLARQADVPAAIEGSLTAGRIDEDTRLCLKLSAEELSSKLTAREDVYTLLRDQMGPVICDLPDSHLGHEVMAEAESELPEPGGGRVLRYEWRGDLLLQRGDIDRVIRYAEHYSPVASSLLAS